MLRTHPSLSIDNNNNSPMPMMKWNVILTTCGHWNAFISRFAFFFFSCHQSSWILEPLNKILFKYTIHKHIACLSLCFYQHIKAICRNNIHRHKNNTLMAGLWASRNGLWYLTTKQFLALGQHFKCSNK